MPKAKKYTIRKEDEKFCLFSKDGAKLGCHDSIEDAQAQERAIKSSEAAYFCQACQLLVFSEADALEHSSRAHDLADLSEPKSKKRSKEFFDDDMRPKLAKADPAAKYAATGGDFEKACGKCRFFSFDSCRLVEGTIEVDAVCKLYREPLDYRFGDFYQLTASELVTDKDGGGWHSHRGEWAFYSPLEFAEVKDGQWIPYLPVPDSYESPRYGTILITAERNRRFVENFRSAVYQAKLPIDAEHETKLSGAMAWVTDMRQNKDGSVDAKVDWTDRGRTLMEGDQFKFFSPEFFDEWQDPATGEVYTDIAIGGALTTRPFFKEKALRPLVASEGGIDALLAKDERAHFEPKEARMTTKKKDDKKQSKGIIARLAKSLETSEAPLTEDELREELRAELATPEKKTDVKDVKDGDKPKGSEDKLEDIDGLPKAAAERITAAEAENKKLREDLVTQGAKTKALEASARSTRLTEIVNGQTKTSKHRWFGDVASNVTMLEELAESVGEDSEVFKAVVKSHSANAAQMAFVASVQLKELGYQGPSDEPDSPELKVAAEARKLMTENPDRYKTIELARTFVWDSHPEWKAASHTR